MASTNRLFLQFSILNVGFRTVGLQTPNSTQPSQENVKGFVGSFPLGQLSFAWGVAPNPKVLTPK